MSLQLARDCIFTTYIYLGEHAWRRRALARFLSGSCSRPEFEVFFCWPNVLKHERDTKLYDWGPI